MILLSKIEVNVSVSTVSIPLMKYFKHWKYVGTSFSKMTRLYVKALKIVHRPRDEKIDTNEVRYDLIISIYIINF